MRKINKSEPPKFAEFKRTKNHKNNWKYFHKREYTVLRNNCKKHILDDEQDKLSAYTEMPIKRFERLKNVVHFDHFIKREFDKLATSNKKCFDWNNLFVDIHEHGEGKTFIEGYDEYLDFGADHKDKFIHTLTDNQKLINPAMEDPHHFFTYLCNGKIEINENLSEEEKERAILTRDAFNLNDGILTKKREDLLNEIRKQDSTLPPEKVLECVLGYGFTSFAEFMLDRIHLYKG